MPLLNASGQPLYVMDRSRLEAAATCPRLYFWAYSFLSLGIREVRSLPAFSLTTGTYVHEGVERVMRGESAMAAAIGAYDEYRADIGPLLDSLDLGDRRELVYREFEQQLDLVMALVYGWALVGWPRYREHYEVVDIEKEEEIGFLVDGTEIRLLTRADIIGKVRGTEGYVIHNLKTVTDASQRWRESWRYDQQTLTERLATEERLGAEVIGTVIEGLCKGKKSEYPKESGFWQHGSPLIWAWADKADGSSLPGESRAFYASYEWTCGEAHVFSNGRKCQGGKQHRLSGVTKVRVQSEYPGGILAWIDFLNVNDHGVLEQQFISLPPLGRSEFEIERWKRQTLPAELKRQRDAEVVNNLFLQGKVDEAYRELDFRFPMHTGHGSCTNQFGRECDYLKVCWEASNVMDDSIWQPRVPNHPAESELIQISLGTGDGEG
jgi:hypothetical protein